jgi:hypothetical protein
VVEGIVKHLSQKDLSMFSQKAGQCWKPLKSITPFTWSVRLAMMFCWKTDREGSEVGLTGLNMISRAVSGMKGLVQVAATWFLEGHAMQTVCPGW